MKGKVFSTFLEIRSRIKPSQMGYEFHNTLPLNYLLNIHKLRHNQLITGQKVSELEKMHFEQGVLKTLEKYIKAYGELPLGTLIWHLIGLDEGAV